MNKAIYRGYNSTYNWYQVGAHLEEVYQEISHDGQHQLQKAKMLRSNWFRKGCSNWF